MALCRTVRDIFTYASPVILSISAIPVDRGRVDYLTNLSNRECAALRLARINARPLAWRQAQVRVERRISTDSPLDRNVGTLLEPREIPITTRVFDDIAKDGHLPSAYRLYRQVFADL